MVACPKCVTNNTLDSTFCKKCGAILPVAVIEEEQEKLKEIVGKGMESYQAGNLDEALSIADHSILTNPSYGEAYALKGLIHERRGEYAEALDSYETVVALNPDSTIDKIKLNQLRNAFAQRQAGEPKVDKKGALAIAASATLFFIAIGFIANGIIQNSNTTKQAQATNQPVQNQPLTNAANQTNVQPNQSTANQPLTNPQQNQQRGPQPGDVPNLGNPDNNPTADRNPHMTTRFKPDRNSGFDDGGVTPIIIDNPNGSGLPTADGEIGGPATRPKNPDPGIDPKPDPVNASNKTTPEPPKEAPGTYDISVSTKAGTGGGSTAKSSSGRSYYQRATTFARSGKTAQAREAYQRAIDAYQKDINSGTGDKEAAQAGINTCKQALKNLKD
ncbi:MAG: tetratricopeptide repeat protein [Armatimonadetes bacterium]|nr:tetratricopeptide repeat protein [Armatimonadota bacterium]